MTKFYYNRYSDMIKSIVGGSFYESVGIVVPYRLGNTEIRLETKYPNVIFNVFINEIYSGKVISDVNGNVVFDRKLPYGEIEITLVNTSNDKKQKTWLTVREYALWLAAYAESVERIDANIQDTIDNFSISNATINGIEDIFGRVVDTYDDIEQSLDSYRWMIHELRLGYRNFGTRYRGKELAVAEFTQIPPFGYTRRLWGPNWILDQSMLVNHRFRDRSHSIINNTGNISGIKLVKVEPDVVSGTPAGFLQYDANNKEFTWIPAGVSGPVVELKDGRLFLPGPPSSSLTFLLGKNVGPYIINVGVNDKLYLDIDDIGLIVVTLITGLPNPTVANIVNDINGALTADVRYGVTYGLVASVYNNKLLLVSPPSVVGDKSINIQHGLNNAAITLFGTGYGDLKFDSKVMNGVEILDINGVVDMDSDSIIEYEYDGSLTVPTRRLRWRSPLAAFGSWVSIDGVGDYYLLDTLGNLLFVYVIPDDMDVLSSPYPATDVIFFSIGYQKFVENVKQNQGLWVDVDIDQLPVSGVLVDNIHVYDDFSLGNVETPDNWQLLNPTGVTVSKISHSDMVTGRLDELKESSAYKLNVVDTSVDVHELVGRVLQFPLPYPEPRGQNSPQRSNGLFYDYEGFTAKFSGWIKNNTSDTNHAVIGFSFDGGVSWDMSSSFILTIDPNGYEDYDYVEFETVIPAGLVSNEVLVKIYIINTDDTGLDFFVDGFAVEVKYISSRYLRNNTIVRSRHRQYFGELDWIWSMNPLTLREQKYIGLQHKASSLSTPFSGVMIEIISNDTVVGLGKIEYEYNPIGNLKRLRWNSAAGDWGIGLGWVTVVNDNIYKLFAVDGSYINVDVKYGLLLSNSLYISKQKLVMITDTTIDQGHIRTISSANSSIDVFDVTEYENDVPLNLFGVIDEGNFSLCDIINMDISSADPFKFAFLIPNRLPIEDEEIMFSMVFPHIATLQYDSDQNQVDAMLFEDGNLVPNDAWHFNSNSQIEILPISPSIPYGFNPGAKYTVSYGLLYQVTTPVIDLGVSTFRDYAWFIDYLLWNRMNKKLGEYLTVVPVFFNPNNGRAFLDKKSSMLIEDSRLYYQSSEEEVQIANRYWRFIDDKTIEIDASQLIKGAQYYLQHKEKRVYLDDQLDVKLEHRSGIDVSSCLSAIWVEKQRNENIDVMSNMLSGNQLIHQLRLSIIGVRDLRDFRIRSLVLKGLHIHGINPNVPGLTNLS